MTSKEYNSNYNYYKNSKYTSNSNQSNYQSGKTYSHYKDQSKNVINCVRKFVPEFELVTPSDQIIRVTTYNTLADSLSAVSVGIEEKEIDMHPYLKLENRRAAIIKEIKSLNSDIIGIQEIEKDIDFINAVQDLGYEVIFKPRPCEHSEGVALLIKSSKFEILNFYSLVFNMNIGKNKDLSTIYDRDNVAVFALLKMKEHDKIVIASCVHLLFNKNRGDIKLAQAYQIIKAVEKLKSYALEQHKPTEGVSTIICADLNSLPCSGVYKLLTNGKLNLTEASIDALSGQRMINNIDELPIKDIKNNLFKKTSIYDELKKNKSNFNKISTEEWLNNILRVEVMFNSTESTLSLEYIDKYKYSTDLNIQSPLFFSSAYASLLSYIVDYFIRKEMKHPFNIMNIPDKNEIMAIDCYGFRAGKDASSTQFFTKNLTLEPPFTTFNKGQMYTVDYIFYEGEGINVARVLNTPDIIQTVSENQFFPSEIYPSDHINLTADFVITLKNKQN